MRSKVHRLIAEDSLYLVTGLSVGNVAYSSTVIFVLIPKLPLHLPNHCLLYASPLDPCFITGEEMPLVIYTISEGKAGKLIRLDYLQFGSRSD